MGNQWGISIEYRVQKKPESISQAFIIGDKFLMNSPWALILGDNFFMVMISLRDCRD